MLFPLEHFADNKSLYLENYWLKNKRAVDAVNELRKQGLELHTANSAFKVGSLDVKAGDYIVRGDQP